MQTEAGEMRDEAEILTRDAMIKALKERGPETSVLEVMQDNVPTVSSRAKLDTALRSLMQRERPVVGVTDAQDRLIGLLTVENLGEMMMIHSARARRRTSRRHCLRRYPTRASEVSKKLAVEKSGPVHISV